MTTSDDWFQIITHTNSIHTWSIAENVWTKNTWRDMITHFQTNSLPASPFALKFLEWQRQVPVNPLMTKTSICNLRSRLRSNLMSSAPYDLAFVTWKIMRSIAWITLDIKNLNGNDWLHEHVPKEPFLCVVRDVLVRRRKSEHLIDHQCSQFHETVPNQVLCPHRIM